MKYKGFGSSKVLGITVLPFYLFTFLLFIACTLSSCVEEYEADISEDDSNLLVVEGAICASQVNKFYLSRTQSLHSSATPQMVTGAKVSVRGTDGTEYVTQEDAVCYSVRIDVLSPDVDYYLHIEDGGEVYESEPQKPIPTEQIAEVKGVQNTPWSNIDVLVTPDAPFEPGRENYYLWTYEETWEVRPEYTTNIRFDPESMTAVYDPHQFPDRGWKNAIGQDIMVSSSRNYDGQHIRQLKLYDIGREGERMFFRYSSLVHQRAITKAEYEYELARRQASSEMGGLFTPQPSQLPTNLRCLTSGKHVIGYVGCSLNTAERRVFFDHIDFSVSSPDYKDRRVWLENCTEEDCLQKVKNGMYLCEWQDDRMIPDGTLRTAWATVYQLDVRLRGAYVEKPYYW